MMHYYAFPFVFLLYSKTVALIQEESYYLRSKYAPFHIK